MMNDEAECYWKQAVFFQKQVGIAQSIKIFQDQINNVKLLLHIIEL